MILHFIGFSDGMDALLLEQELLSMTSEFAISNADGLLYNDGGITELRDFKALEMIEYRLKDK